MAEPAPEAAPLDGRPPWLAPAGLAAAVLLAAGFWWTGHWMVLRWTQTNSYYSHGWLIPPASAVLLYMRRRELLRCPVRPSGWGLALLLPALLAHVVATAWQVGFISGFAFLGVVAGLVWTLLGARVLRVAAFPIAFLAFMVPLPEVLVETVSFRLKLAAAALATGFVELLGMVAVREGSYVHMPSGTVVVDDVCSGLKYLISLTAFGALYAGISSLRGWRRAALFLSAIPVAFFANVGRVILLLLIAYRWGPEHTEKWYSHDVLGLVLFAVAFGMLFGLEGLLGDQEKRPEATAAEDEGAGTAPPVRGGASTAGPAPRAALTAVLGALAVAGAASLYLSWPRPTADAGEVLASVPQTLGGWQGYEYRLEERVYDILGTRDVLSRSYVNGRDEQVDLMIVLAQQIRRRTHPPEQCIGGEGSRITASRERLVELPDTSRQVRVRELVVDRGEARQLVWYFYKSGPHLSTSYWRHQAGVALRKLAEPDAADILVRVDAPVAAGDLEAARAVQARFLAHALPALMRRLP